MSFLEPLKYTPQAQSVGFEPVAITTPTEAIERNQRGQLESLKAALQMERDNKDAVNRIKLKNKEYEWAALGQFSKTIAAEAERIAKQTAEDIEIGSMYDAMMEGFSDSSPEARNMDRAEEEAITEGERQGDQVARLAYKMEQDTGNPAIGNFARQQLGGLARGVANEQALLMRSQASYGASLAAYLESNATFRLGGRSISVREAMASGDPRLVQAAITAGRHEFIRANGLQYATKRNFVKYMMNTMLSSEGSIGGAAVRSAIKAQREETINKIDGLGYDLAQTTDASGVDGAFHQLSDMFFRHNTGMSRAEANEAAIKALISGWEDSGNTEALEALLDVYQKPGQAGTELRRRYGNLINDAIDRSYGKADTLDSREARSITDRLYEDLAGLTDVEQRQQRIDAAADEMESLGLYRQARELRNNFESLTVEGGAEFNATVVEDAITNGEITTAQQVQDLVKQGKITRSDGARLIKSLEAKDVTKDPVVKSVVDQWADNAEVTFLTAVGLKKDGFGNIAIDQIAGDAPPLSVAEAKTVVAQMRRDMTGVAASWASINGTGDAERTNQGLNKVLSQWVNDNLKADGGKYQINDLKTKDGNGVETQNKAALNRIKGYALPEVLNTQSKIRKDFKPHDFSGRVSNGEVPSEVASWYRSERKDKLFDATTVEGFQQQFEEGRVSPALQKAAQKLNKTPLALLNEQLRANGMEPILPTLSVNTPVRSGSRSSAPLTSSVSGANYLMTTHGMTAKGASWLAGNIQTESGWNGQRSWDDVGARAGGLASWRAGRLTALEQHFGRPVTQIPQRDQLDYLINDLRTNYPNQWRVFNNPRATDRMLLDASYQYWRWGEQGNRVSNAQQTFRQLNGRRAPRPSAVTGNGAQRAISVGRQLQAMGTKMWQNSAFDLDQGYVGSGGRVGQHSPTSYHYHDQALDIPLSHNSQAQLQKTWEYLKRNQKRLGIAELFWNRGGFYKNGRSIGGAGSNAIPNHDSHIHVAFS